MLEANGKNALRMCSTCQGTSDLLEISEKCLKPTEVRCFGSSTVLCMKALRLIPSLSLLACVALSAAQSLDVFAAASLKESATEIARAFEKKHPGVKISLNFAGSQQLSAQIRQGAPVDVLLSAGMEPLKSLTYDRSSLRVFASNALVIVVPAGSGKIHYLKDLSNGFHLIVADRRVPIGNYTEKMLDKAAKAYGLAWRKQFEANVVSREQDVRAVLTKIKLKEADAGIVYMTDAKSARGKVDPIYLQKEFNVTAEYPAVTFKGSANSKLAQEFMRFLNQGEAALILSNHGFLMSARFGAAAK